MAKSFSDNMIRAVAVVVVAATLQLANAQPAPVPSMKPTLFNFVPTVAPSIDPVVIYKSLTTLDIALISTTVILVSGPSRSMAARLSSLVGVVKCVDQRFARRRIHVAYLDDRALISLPPHSSYPSFLPTSPFCSTTVYPPHRHVLPVLPHARATKNGLPASIKKRRICPTFYMNSSLPDW